MAKLNWTEHEREDHTRLIFDRPVKEHELDAVNASIHYDYPESIIDWRDDQECWIWDKERND